MASWKRRLGFFARGSAKLLAPFALAGLCLAVSGGMALLIYPYVREGPWFRDAAVVVTATVVFSVFARFWAAVKAGFCYAAGRFRRGYKEVRLARIFHGVI